MEILEKRLNWVDTPHNEILSAISEEILFLSDMIRHRDYSSISVRAEIPRNNIKDPGSLYEITAIQKNGDVEFRVTHKPTSKLVASGNVLYGTDANKEQY